MQIYVITPQGKAIQIDVQLDKTTVLEIKKKLVDKTGIQIENQILEFNDTVLVDNDFKIGQYNIDKEAKLTLYTIKLYTDMVKQKIQLALEEKENFEQRMYQEQNQVKELEKVLEKTKDSFASQAKELADIKDQNKRLERQVEELKQRQVQINESQVMSKSKFTDDDKAQKLQKQVFELQAELKYLHVEKLDKEEQIKSLKDEKTQFQNKIDDMYKLKEELMDQKFEVKNLKKQLEWASQSGQSVQSDQSREIQNLNNQIKQLQIQLKDFQNENQELQIKLVQNQVLVNQGQDRDNQQKLEKVEKQVRELQLQNDLKEQQIKNLQDEKKAGQNTMLSSLRDTTIREYQENIFVNSYINFQNLESKVAQLQVNLDIKTKAFEESQTQVGQLRKDIYQKDKSLSELENSIDNLKQLLREKDRKYKELEMQIQQKEIINNDLRSDIDRYQQQLGELKKISMNINPQQVIELDQKFLNTEEILRKREQQRKQDEREAREKKEREQLAKHQEIKKEQEQMNELMKKDKAQRQRTAQFLKKQMMDSHGKIEVCFLIDITASMDPYKEQAMRCINESIKNIKIKTNRDALWASVAYQDFGELKSLGGLYKQINFTQNAQDVERFLREQKCEGGGDYAEDVRGGIKQMISNLSWSKTFKIAVLICDAPTHGKRYNGGVSDRYQNEDIEDAIKMLIENNILFIGILFNKVTLTMFEEIKKIYQSYDREELLLFADLANTQEGMIWQELVDLVSQASLRATQTNNKGTKSKNAEANKRSQSGAMEALCKTMKNPFEFDKQPGVKIVTNDFKVFRVDMKQDSFEANIENINRLNINSDYVVQEVGQWNCLRTQTFFAQGQMKQVFLMKKTNNNQELYVIKMPLGDKTYSNIQQAVQECRSHLIAKCLMRKFIRELQEARDAKDKYLKFPEPTYSDFLILQESPNSYWIAERFFQGEFVKFNNNYGYISDDVAELNQIAQAYSYYTYFISNFNYIVSDVQGVGLYFTDPAINTKEGSFDETDMGQDGIAMYTVSYDGKKHLGAKYLSLLNINIE